MQPGNYIKVTGPATVNMADYLADNQTLPIERLLFVCNSTAGAITLQLPKIANLNGFTNLEILIDDQAGTSATNNITVIPYAGDSINNVTTNFILNKNGEKCLFLVADTTQWLELNSSCCQDTEITEYNDAFTGSYIDLLHLVDQALNMLVVVDGQALRANTGLTVRDYSLSEVAIGQTRVTFTAGIVAKDVMIQYSYIG